MGEQTIDVANRLVVIAVLGLVVTGWALQERIRASYAALVVSRDSPSATDVDRARAYGQVGKLLLAAELYDQAEAYLLSARALEPNELQGRLRDAACRDQRGDASRPT